MPWEHCGSSVMDDEACPACGARKGSWTVRQDATRAFVISGPREGEEEQAETLNDAADAGAPFCEDCQEQDNAPEQEPAPERAQEPPSDPDEDAQIATLEGAAESGAPFCQECQKQENEAPA